MASQYLNPGMMRQTGQQEMDAAGRRVKAWEMKPSMLRKVENAGTAATDATDAALSFPTKTQSFSGSDPRISETSLGPGRFYGYDEQARDRLNEAKYALRRGDTAGANLAYKAYEDARLSSEKKQADEIAYAQSRPTGSYAMSVAEAIPPANLRGWSPEDLAAPEFQAAPLPAPTYMDARLSAPREFQSFDAAQGAGNIAAVDQATQVARTNPAFINQRAIANIEGQLGMNRVLATDAQKAADFDRAQLESSVRSTTAAYEDAARMVAAAMKLEGDPEMVKREQGKAFVAFNEAKNAMNAANAGMQNYKPRRFEAPAIVDPLAIGTQSAAPPADEIEAISALPYAQAGAQALAILDKNGLSNIEASEFNAAVKQAMAAGHSRSKALAVATKAILAKYGK